MTGTAAVFVSIVIFAFFFCLGGTSVMALWYLKQSVKELFEYLTVDVDEEQDDDEEEKTQTT